MSYGLKDGSVVERTAQRFGKPRSQNTMNIKKLLAKGHLVPIYEAREDTIFLIGYRRKARSRKAHQRPFMLKTGVAIAKIPKEPETE